MRSVLVTRPQPVADEMAEKLRREGFEAFVAPMTEYVELHADYAGLDRFQAVVFTSAQAVNFFAGRTDARSFTVFAVGDATAVAAGRCGFAKVYSAEGDSDDVIRMIREKQGEMELKHLLHVCGEDTSQDLGRALKDDGIEVTRLSVYKAAFLEVMPPEVEKALMEGRIGTVTLFSARTASNFVRLLQRPDLKGVSGNLEAVCISDRVAAIVNPLPWKAVRVAANPHLEAVMDILRKTATGEVPDPEQGERRNEYRERRKSDDRRKRHTPLDARGHVHTSAYVGPDRRTGLDRRAYQERQQQRIRAEKMKFINRTLLTAAFLFIPIVLVGVFLMAPEYFSLQHYHNQMQQMEDQMRQMNDRLQQMQETQRKQETLGSRLHSQIESVTQAATAVSEGVGSVASTAATLATGAASQAAGAARDMGPLFKVLSNFSALSRTPEGRQATAKALQSLRGALSSSAADREGMGRAVERARADDPALQAVMGHVEPKDLGAAAMLLMLNEFRGNVGGGRPFQEDLALMQKLAGNDPELQASLQKLAPYAKNGVLSSATLQGEFKGLAGDIVMAKLQGEDLSVQEKALKRLDKLVKVRRIDDIEGKSTDAVVARAQLMLDRGDVQGALHELQALEGAPAEAAAPWMQQAAGSLMAGQSADLMTQALMGQLASGGDFSVESLIGTVKDALSGGGESVFGGDGGAGGTVPYMSPSFQQKGGVGGLAPRP